jgi:hypothetical protein
MFSTRFLFMPIVLAQFLVPLLPQLGIGQTIGVRAVADGVPPELPIGVFFSIWGVIFLGLVLIAYLQLRRPDHAGRRIAPPLMMAAFGNLLWMLSAQTLAWVWLDFLLLLPIAFFTWEAAYRLDRTESYNGTLRSILYGLTVGLFAGWLTVAVSISVPDVVRAVLDRGASDAVWQSLWMALVPAVALAYVFASHVSRNGWYFVALAWGLLGVAVNNWVRLETHALALVTLAVAGYVLLRRMRYGARGSYPADA